MYKTKKLIINTKWSHNLAYAVGLIATDGNLSSDGRHISFVSKDLEQVTNLMKALNINVSIYMKNSGSNKSKVYHTIQFSNVVFYKFLNKIGIHKAKSKTISAIKFPVVYFPSFLAGIFDGDGYTHVYKDKRWKNSIMFYLGLSSASGSFVLWLKSSLNKYLGVKGHISKAKNNSCYNLRYAKREALRVVRYFYGKNKKIGLSRKRLKIRSALAMMGEPINI